MRIRTALNGLAAAALVTAPIAAASANTRASEAMPAAKVQMNFAESVSTERSTKPVKEGEELVAGLLPLFIVGGIAATLVVLEVTGAINITGDDASPGS
tara:strand:+ start:942 stop:1238 length:297 start_codon:yes stop_codon:yes gene_type:complete